VAEDLKPSYQQIGFAPDEKRGKLRLLAAPEATDGSTAVIHQQTRLYVTEVDGSSVTHAIAPGRHAWVQVIRGEVTANGQPLKAGDGAAVSDEQALTFAGNGELLLFDLS
jgi:quercetin 2,3-dioxygenase